MPGPNDPIASSRAKIFVVPPDGGDPFLLGVVEDFSATNQYASENLPGVGNFSPVDNVVNTVQGRLRWGRVLKLNRRIQQTIAPEVARYAEYQAFDVLAVDPKDSKPIARCIDCLPESLDVTMTNGRALRQQYSGLCKFVQHGDEVLQAAA